MKMPVSLLRVALVVTSVVAVSCASVGTRSDQLDSQMVAHWKFDEKRGTTIVDSSGNGHTGILLNGDPDWISGKYNGALDLRPTATVLVPSSIAFMTKRVTVSAWVKPRSQYFTGQQDMDVFRKEDGENRILLAFRDFGTTVVFGINIYGYGELSSSVSSATLTDGNWHQVAVTYDGSYKRCYLDGTLIGSVAITGDMVTTGSGNVYLGSSSGNEEYYNGGLDEVRFYSRALGMQEIFDLYQQK